MEASVFVVACSAIESARLLLLSTGPKHPHGLGNGRGLVGRNLLFSTFASATGSFPYDRFQESMPWLDEDEPWVNRALQDWYVIDDEKLGRRKGGTLSFLRPHPNPVQAAVNIALEGDVPLWGEALKDKLHRYFRGAAHLRIEAFGEYTPTPSGMVVLDPGVKDKWGMPVARVRIYRHPRDRETAGYLNDRAREILARMDAEDIRSPEIGGESSNLVAGTCRFGDDPEHAVLDPDCRAWEVDNLYVTDGSFMPTGGSVPYTFTIYANAFRVAERIVAKLGGVKTAPPGGR